MRKKRKTEIEPTPEDRQRVLDKIANSREILMERMVEDEARRRVEAEREAARQERRRRFFRRLFPFRRAA
jgi:hypothetical protein